jgi:DNA polymerase-1
MSIGYICPRSCPALVGQKISLPIGKISDDWFNELVIGNGEITHLAIQDSALFKKLTGRARVVNTTGYVFKSKYGNYHVCYVPPFKSITLDERVRNEARLSIEALEAHLAGRYVEPGTTRTVVVHSGQEWADWVERLLSLPRISVDLETTGLKHHESTIRTIGFGISENEAVVFEWHQVEASIRYFFEQYTGKIIMHKGAFDLTQLIHKVWMKKLSDTNGIYEGLKHLQSKTECSMILSYVVTNTCAGNELGLKPQTQSEYGDYGIDEPWKAPLKDVIEYNGKDCAATLWLYDKHMANLGELAHVFKRLNSYLREIVWMQLCGLPIDQKVAEKNARLLSDRADELIELITNHEFVIRYMVLHRERWAVKRNLKLKKKRVTPEECTEIFNPNSPIQLQALLYEVLQLPILGTTRTGQPSTDGDTLKALCNHSTEAKEFLEWLVELAQIEKLLSSFVPHFVNAPAVDGYHCLYGFYNIGGTQSGRLSSDSPNQQNLPSHEKHGFDYAIYIKQMVKAPKGWLFVGADFASLEDKIITLLTRDPNRLKVYEDGYDGHSLRTFYYFRDQMPDIEDTLESINSIGSKYKHLRYLSKPPTFALTYFGTWKTLMTNCGFSEEDAKKIEANFHELYKASDEWNAAKLARAARDGYTTLAFGLRLFCPVLHASVHGRLRPSEAAAEERSAGNAFGQSYGLLNSRAAHAFMDRVIEAKLWNDIRPAAQIHDAQYYWVRRDVKLVKWVNDNLIPEMEWQDLPELGHPTLKLGGELIVYDPDWSSELHIPNGASYGQIGDLLNRIKK